MYLVGHYHICELHFMDESLEAELVVIFLGHCTLQ